MDEQAGSKAAGTWDQEAKERGQPLEPGLGKGAHPPLEPSGGKRPCGYFLV